MVVVLFHIKTRPDVDQNEYQRTFERMMELVSAMPGFQGLDGFAGEDGSELAVARFDSDESVRAWKEQPEHVRTQERGRTEFFDTYEITVAEVSRQYSWSATAGRSTGP
jgi:heme-degrading monooxygenase HmoA